MSEALCPSTAICTDDVPHGDDVISNFSMQNLGLQRHLVHRREIVVLLRLLKNILRQGKLNVTACFCLEACKEQEYQTLL